MGHAAVHIAQILQGHCIAGVDAHGTFQRRARHIQFARLGVQHRQIVVWLGNFRIFLRDAQKLTARLSRFALRHQYARAQQAHLRVARVIGQIRIGRLQRASVVFGSDELIDFAIVFPHQRGLRSLRHGRTAAQQRSGCQHNTCRDSRKKSWLHHEQNTSTIRQLVHYPLFPS